MSDNKVIFLAFKNDQLVEDQRDLLACKRCRNKAFALVHFGPDAYTRVECTACHMDLGPMGWADEDAQ